MVKIKLSGIDFFNSPNGHEHTAAFRIDCERPGNHGSIAVAVANVDGGFGAVHVRAWENAVSMLKQALASAEQQLEISRKVEGVTHDGSPA
jgi:hypothetical protein